MLMLSRRFGETLVINGNIRITILKGGGSNQVKVGIDAPREISVHREEIQEKVDKAAELDMTWEGNFDEPRKNTLCLKK